jgi:sepiapterin reductase
VCNPGNYKHEVNLYILMTSLYCAAKASREMFFNTLVLEYPSIKVLHYAPGPMDTVMQSKIRSEMEECKIKTSFRELFESGGLVNPNDSAKEMLGLLRNGFTNASHVDYYDLCGSGNSPMVSRNS